MTLSPGCPRAAVVHIAAELALGVATRRAENRKDPVLAYGAEGTGGPELARAGGLPRTPEEAQCAAHWIDFRSMPCWCISYSGDIARSFCTFCTSRSAT